MTVKANGTDAKDIALYYLQETDQRATPAIMKKIISQAKVTLESGYTKQQVLSVIDRIVDKRIDIYSYGYINSAINDILREINEEESKVDGKRIQKEMEEHLKAQRNKAVKNNDETVRRNREKSERFGIESRLRKKYNFNQFTEQ